MTRSEHAGKSRVGRERQDAARGQHRVLAHDHGAVVERRAGAEEGLEQGRRNLGVDARPGVHEVAQPHVALEHDERALAAQGQRLRPAHDLPQHAVAVAAQERPEVARAPELGQRVA